jgi:hypothetical protein
VYFYTVCLKIFLNFNFMLIGLKALKVKTKNSLIWKTRSLTSLILFQATFDNYIANPSS